MKKIFWILFIGIFVAILSNGVANADTCTASISVSDHSSASTENSIQWCINSLPSGGTVELASDTYYTSDTIEITSDITIQGNGKEDTIIQYNGSSSADVISNNASPVTNVTIQDLTIIGSGDDTDDDQTCILFKKIDGTSQNERITIRSVKVKECGQYGIHIKDTNGVHLIYNTLRYNGSDREKDHNIYLRNVSNAKVELSTSNRAAGNGLNVTDSDNVIVRNLKVKYNGQNGVRFANSDYVKAYQVTASWNGYREGQDDPDPCDQDDEFSYHNISDDLCNGIEFRTEDDCEEDAPSDDDCHDTYDGVTYGCVEECIANNNYSFWLYIRSATSYELNDNSKDGNRQGGQTCSIDDTDAEDEDADDKCVSTSSSADENACETINPTSWPFDGSTDSDYTAAAIAAFEAGDADDDGYDSSDAEGDDCDDSDDAIHPDASESCDDGVDQDCSGADLSCNDVDNDGDGYTENQGDCDESTNGRNPGVFDSCDGIDNNCDDQIDPDCDDDSDGLANSEEWSLGTDPNDTDSDNDSISDYQEVQTGSDPTVYTDIITPILELLLSSDDDGDGYDSEDDGGDDCNDSDSSIYVGATEVCGDGIDQDCDGVDTSCDTDGDGLNDDVEVTEGSDPNDPLSVACVTPSTEEDWTITSDCTFFSSKTWSGDLYVQSEAVVTIPSGISLDLDLSQKKLVVQSGSGVLIEQGGSLR